MRYLHLSFFIILLLSGSALAQPGGGKSDSPGHDNPDCRSCHLRTAARESRLVAAADDCRSCHGKQFRPGATEFGFHGQANAGRCLDCHSYHDPGQIQTGAGAIYISDLSAMNLGHCRSCHDGGKLTNLSDAHRAAAALYHEQAASLQAISPSQACLNCHSNSSATDWQSQADGKVLAFSEHATHPYEVEVVPGRGSFAHRIRQDLDPDIVLVDQQIQCLTCHLLTLETKGLVRNQGEKSDLCLGCHQFRDQPRLGTRDLVATMTDHRP